VLHSVLKTAIRFAVNMSTSVPKLDRAAFEKIVTPLQLTVQASDTAKVLKVVRGLLWRVPAHKPVVPNEENPCERFILLGPKVDADMGCLPEAQREAAAALVRSTRRIERKIGYEEMTATEVLGEILPDGMDVPSSYEAAGHLLHVNLLEEQRPWKHIIGEVLLDKVPSARTVVTKTGNIESEYRTFPMEVIGGEEDFNVQVREGGCTFEFDYRQVYWNSRLQMEHSRIVKKIAPGSIVVDMFAGVGPFALPLAKKGVEVFANDKNPASHAAMLHNIALNKLSRKVHAENMCGRAYLRGLLAQPGFVVDHCLMNIPALGIEFCDSFVAAFPASYPRKRLPLVHTYCFSKGESPEACSADVKKRLADRLECDLAELPSLAVRVVRDVAPAKLMMCVEWRVPPCVAYARGGGGGDMDAASGGGGVDDGVTPPSAKRHKPAELQ
jgi:tRNA (guanine37-N1)-methyltransferase